MAQLSLNLVTMTNLKFQETWQIPSKINTTKGTPGHIIVKLLKNKDKEKILKVTRGKKTHYVQGKSYATFE